MGRLSAKSIEIQDEDFYELVANNKYLKKNLENEIRGFAIYLVNGNNLDIINSCSQYSQHKDIEAFCGEVDEICHNFAQQFYEREFTDQQIEGFQKSDGLKNVFKNFSQTGNIVLFKNQLLNLLIEDVERFDTQQTSNFGNLQDQPQMDSRQSSETNIKPMGSPVKKKRITRLHEKRDLRFSTIERQESTVAIPHVFAMMQQFDFLSPAHKEYISQ